MLCPALDSVAQHPWQTIREGVRWCPCCETLEYDVIGNLVHFPIASQFSGPPVRRDSLGKIVAFPAGRSKVGRLASNLRVEGHDVPG